MKVIGLLFGSFNPIHMGHLIIANYMVNFTPLQEVWLVVSPHNPLKNQIDLIDVYDRLEMAKLATAPSTHIKVSEVELQLPQPSYTIDTLSYLAASYPQYQFRLIMGSDCLTSFTKWKNYERILQEYHLYVYPRHEAKGCVWAVHPSVTITNAPRVELSATFIRKAIQEHKNLQFFLPDSVIDFIHKKNLYSA